MVPEVARELEEGRDTSMTPSARIAVVDDDPEYAAVLEQMLGCHGYDVVKYESGSAFLAGLGTQPVPDVVLLDMVMPGLDGLGTLKRARMQVPDLPVIMVSGQQKPANIVDSVRAGALDYIVKSATAASNPAALEGAIRGPSRSGRCRPKSRRSRRNCQTTRPIAFSRAGRTPRR